MKSQTCFLLITRCLFFLTPALAQWTQLGLDIDPASPGGEFGLSVALSADGSIVAIGAYLNRGVGNDAGHTRVFEWIPEEVEVTEEVVEELPLMSRQGLFLLGTMFLGIGVFYFLKLF